MNESKNFSFFFCLFPFFVCVCETVLVQRDEYVMYLLSFSSNDFFKLFGLLWFPERFHIHYPILNSKKGFLSNIANRI